MNCRDCQDLHREVVATRMIGKTPVCEMHCANRLGQKFTAPAAPVEEKTMGRGGGTSEETIKAIQEDAAAGMSYNQIAEKEGVSWPTVKRYAQNGQKSAGGAKKEKPQRRGGVFGKAGQGSYSVELSAAGLDAVWNGLTPEKKAELLRGL